MKFIRWADTNALGLHQSLPVYKAEMGSSACWNASRTWFLSFIPAGYHVADDHFPLGEYYILCYIICSYVSTSNFNTIYNVLQISLSNDNKMRL